MSTNGMAWRYIPYSIHTIRILRDSLNEKTWSFEENIFRQITLTNTNLLPSFKYLMEKTYDQLQLRRIYSKYTLCKFEVIAFQ